MPEGPVPEPRRVGDVRDGARGHPAPGRHGRLEWLGPDELDTEQRALYLAIVDGPRASSGSFSLTDPSGRLEGPFNAMLFDPPIGAALEALGAAIRYRGTLTDRQREVAILELARRRVSGFEWYAHAAAGPALELGPQTIEALRTGAAAHELDDAESAVRDVVGALVSTRDLGDALYRRALDALGVRALVELVILVGYYDLLALSMAVWRTPLPDGEVDALEGVESGR